MAEIPVPDIEDDTARTPYEIIYESIVEGTYAPGQRLIEQRIAEELNVSRTPVREAIRKLESSGLVTTLPYRGAIVREHSPDEIRDLYELRSVLEGLAAERAASRAEESDIKAMDFAIEEFGEAIMLRDDGMSDVMSQINRANRKFHNAVLQAARHERLSQLLMVTVDAPLTYLALSRLSRSESIRSHEFHKLIRKAIVNQEPVRARHLMMEHIYQGRDALTEDAPPQETPTPVAVVEDLEDF